MCSELKESTLHLDLDGVFSSLSGDKGNSVPQDAMASQVPPGGPLTIGKEVIRALNSALSLLNP